MEQSSLYDELQKNYDRVHERSLTYDKPSKLKADSRQSGYSRAPISRPAVDQYQYPEVPRPTSNQYRQRDQVRILDRRPNSRSSVGTIGMLNSSYNSAHDIALDDNMLNNSNLSAVLNQERDPIKLRTFFKEFSEAIRNNKRRDASGL